MKEKKLVKEFLSKWNIVHNYLMYNHRGVNRTSDNANYFSNTIAYSSFLFDNPYDIFVGLLSIL